MGKEKVPVPEPIQSRAPSSNLDACDACEVESLPVGELEHGIAFVYEYAHTKPLHGWTFKGYADAVKGAGVVDPMSMRLKEGWVVEPDSITGSDWLFAKERSAAKWDKRSPKLIPAYWRRRKIRVSHSAPIARTTSQDSEELVGTVVVLENERRKPLGSWSPDNLLLTDPPHWSDTYGTGPVDRDGLVPPLPQPVEWSGEWAPEEKWEYSACFRLGTFVTDTSGWDAVLCRRRVWRRRYRVLKRSAVLSIIPDNHFKYLNYMLAQGNFHARKNGEKAVEKAAAAATSTPPPAHRVGGKPFGVPAATPLSPGIAFLNESFATPERTVRSLHCMVCEEEYTMFKLEHHCRSCYLSTCDDCSKSAIGIEGYGTNMRCCKVCVERRGHAEERSNTIFRVIRDFHAERKATVLNRLHEGGREVRELSIAGSVGSLRVCLKEGYAVSSAFTGKMGFPNPQVDFYLCGAYVRSPTKTQTNHPVWGEAACTYGIPYSDPTATLFFAVYNVSISGVFSRTALGRGAIPLQLVRDRMAQSTEKGPIDIWVELLPPRLNEVEGYDKVAPSRFRGCSPVCGTLGMRDPKKCLGYIRLTLEDSLTPNELLQVEGGGSFAELAKATPRAIPIAYIMAPVHKVSDDLLSPADEDALPKAIDRLKDSVNRVQSGLGPPYLLLYIWAHQPVALAAVPLWYGLATSAYAHHIPFIVLMLLLCNGYLASFDKAYEGNVCLFEEDNTYKGPSFQEAIQKVQMILSVVRKLQAPVASAASNVTKASSALAFRDPGVSRAALAVLSIATVLSSLAIYIASFLPLRLYLFALGVVLMCIPTLTPSSKSGAPEKPGANKTPPLQSKPAPESEAGSPTPSSAAGRPPLPSDAGSDAAQSVNHEPPPVEDMQVYQPEGRDSLGGLLGNLLARVPDDRELAHRVICRGQVVADPRSGAQAGQASESKRDA